MKIGYQWIKEFVDLDVDAQAAATALTMSGIEVEEVAPSTIPAGVVAARILEVKPHPNADKLSLCSVDAGQGPVEVVCGAPNVRPGLLSAYAPEGVDLGGGFVVKKAKIRGVASVGILLSEKELGLTDDHTGIMEIEADLQPGTPLLDGLDLTDAVLNINVTPNRGDCLSALGIARELAAIYKRELKAPACDLVEIDEPADLQVEIIATTACERYCARVLKGVRIGKSPFWMRRRLFQAGVRAISNIVDITNYVMLELGQPLHAFDYTRVSGKAIIVRKARDAERFITLDQAERMLTAEDLLICDAEKPVALAGVMGGLNSEVEDTTTTVALESAYFEPVGIRRTARRLGLPSEAAYRFERGIDPEIQARAANRAAELMAQLADARICKGLIDCDHRRLAKPQIPVRAGYLARVLGLSTIAKADVTDIFTRLGCGVTELSDGWNVTPPALRHDLEREIDMVEEFIRIFGMDKVTPELPVYRPAGVAVGDTSGHALRARLAAMGLSEVVTYSFIAPLWKRWFGDEALELKNPISDEMRLMRTSLIPGIVSAVAKNKNLQTRDLAIFEFGRCFSPRAGQKLPEEQERLAVAISGQRRDPHWSETRQNVDFYDIKGLAETLYPGVELQAAELPFLAPGMQARMLFAGTVIGHLGLVHADILAALDIIDEVFVLEAAAPQAQPWQGLQGIARFPMTWRDLSLVVDEAVPYNAIEQAVRALAIPEMRRVAPIDLYVGDKLPAGKKGITIRITYQSAEQTLADKQINTWQDAILHALEKGLGAVLRQ